MLESKWVLFLFLLFGFGQLLANQMTDIVGTSSAALEEGIQVVTSEDLEELAPTADETLLENVVGAAFRGIGVIRNLVLGLVKALAWEYDFLKDGVGAIFRTLILWPLSGMMSLMIASYVRNLIRL